MVEKPSGDPAPQLTREDVQRLHAAMAAAEPDWMQWTNVLASGLERAVTRLGRGILHDELQTVAHEYRRDVEAWHRLADDYFRAVGGPITELLPFAEDEDVERV